MKSRKLVSLSILVGLSIVPLIGCDNKSIAITNPIQQNIIIATPQITPSPSITPTAIDNEVISTEKPSWRPLMCKNNEFGVPDYKTKEARDREDKEMIEQINKALKNMGEE